MSRIPPTGSTPKHSKSPIREESFREDLPRYLPEKKIEDPSTNPPSSPKSKAIEKREITQIQEPDVVIVDRSSVDDYKSFRKVFSAIRTDMEKYIERNRETLTAWKVMKPSDPTWLYVNRYPIRHFRAYHQFGLDMVNSDHPKRLAKVKALEESFQKHKSNLYKEGIHPAASPVDIFNTLAACQAFQKKYKEAAETIKEGYQYTGDRIVYDFQDAEYDLRLTDKQVLYS